MRDEILRNQLSMAETLKQQDKFDQSLKMYQDALNNEFLSGSDLDHHKHMRYSIHRNVGDLLFATKQYFEAKEQYEKALHIKPQESYIWKQIGELEYTHLQNFKLAERCFGHAYETSNTME